MGQGGPKFAVTIAASMHELSKTTSFQALEKAAAFELGQLGFDLTVGAIVQRKCSEAQEVGFLFGGTDHPWIKHYQEADLGVHCPITASAGNRPLGWAEIKSKPLSAQQRGVFDQLRDFQLVDGFILGIENVGRTTMVVSSGGRDVDLRDPLTRTLAHLLSVNYGALALAYWRDENDMPVHETVQLRPRQLDCLRWVLEGKSSSVIAEILGVSPKTVDEHLEKACTALGVRTRVQACAEALRLGLITL